MEIKTAFRDGTYLSGLILNVLSLFFFLMGQFFPFTADNPFGLFLINYAIAIFYFILILARGRLKKEEEGLPLMFIFLILSLISAYALNRQMSVFDRSTTWWCVVLVASCTNYLLLPYSRAFPVWVRQGMWALAGVSLVAFVYLSVYLLPLYAISLPGIILIGISLHTYVPLLFVVYTLVWIKRMERRYWRGFVVGVGMSVAVIVVFAVSWGMMVNHINRDYRRATLVDDEGLPAWVRVSREIPHNWIAERALKTGLVYSEPARNFDDVFWRMPSRNFGEETKHDPLVMVGALFGGTLAMGDAERIKVLEAMYDSRHQAEERLWSGDDLITETVQTQVRIWPEDRLSYTETNVTVTNTSHGNGGWHQEALYTFHLAEGAVVTSLSLWIDGKEFKSVLTSQAKADSAYRQIVGYEMRDPSVVHWREGNRVVVRVFPVEAGMSRRFKLGVTAPLDCTGNHMEYTPLYFDGPVTANADEDISVDLVGNPDHVSLSPAFEQAGPAHYERSGKYRSDWTIQMDDTRWDPSGFTWNGNNYRITPEEVHPAHLSLTDVYLDINRSWTKAECDAVYAQVKDKQVWVFLDGQKEEGSEAAFDKLRRQQFSLFPFDQVKGASSALVITKGAEACPTLGDIKESALYGRLAAAFKDSGRVNVFCLDGQLSPYLQGLKEFRAFHYLQGSLENLMASEDETEDRLNIDQSHVSIIRTAAPKGDSTMTGSAPDHLMRLFAYNDILRRSGADLFAGPVVRADILEEAQKAYVVSPVSSLVVLERQEDYEAFDIHKSKQSLENATLKAKGSAPEPGEWALIIVVGLCLLLTYRYRPYIKRA